MDTLIIILIAAAIVVSIILFFAPIIMIWQLAKIINLLDRIGYSEEEHHQELKEILLAKKQENKNTPQ